MPITLVTGPANAGKAEVVMDAVRRHLAHGREPLLIVPRSADVEHYLRELAGERVAMGVRVARFSELIDEAVRRAGVAEAVLGGLARERVMATLAVRRAGAGAPVGSGLVRALGELFEDLQVRRVSPARLAVALRAGLGAEADALGVDLIGIYGDYHATLARLGRHDAEQRALRALDGLRERPSLWGSTPVLIYGFDDLTRLQLDAIETLGRVVDVEVTVSLAYEAGRTAFAGRASTFQALAPLAAEHRALASRADYYAEGSRTVLAHLERSLFEPAARRVDPAQVVELLQGGGERAELELIAERVGDLLERGMPAHEIAVIVRRPELSAGLVADVFGATAIPFAMPIRRPLGDSAVGRALIGLLRCVPGPDGAPTGTPADLFTWLRAPGQLKHLELVDSLELSVRRNGLTAAEARSRWEERHWRLEAIDHLADAQGRGPGALIERAARELEWLFSAPRRGRASVLGAGEMDEARALAGGRRALAELRDLSRLAAEAVPDSAAELAQALAGVEVYAGELPGPGAVAVLDPLSLRARRVRALFASGLQEGVFPEHARPQPLLSEQQRSRIAVASGLRLGEPEDVLASERYLLYAVLSRPQERLALSWHESDDDGGPLSRSLFVDDVCDLFDERLESERARRALGAVDRLGAAKAAVAMAPGGLRDERVLAELRDRVWSASSIERWVGCPVAWFVDRLLDPAPFEPDAEPLARGGLAHAALKDTLEALRRETGSAKLRPANLELARELLARALNENEPRHPLSVIAERRVAVRRSLHADLERYLAHAAVLDGPLAPGELELGFGFTGEDEHSEASELPAFELGGGVLMRGRIDRIDVEPGGDAVVIDYKASSAPPGARWLKGRQLQVALYMQAARELLGLRVIGGLYQPLSGKALQARGAMSVDEPPLECKANDLYEPDELEELLDAVLDTARAAAAEAASGALEPRPATCAFRGGCRYPTICRCER
ncbi:MAG TPA: PD-(D/E)XK nuclease family protein [Solirubrobacteraceae bacterium]|jgi:ATP-dependent helicase/DNAse subunit B|nr:PD-(D/E)XK nuclease family protein [Solirubrobacteraceae bacterium]